MLCMYYFDHNILLKCLCESLVSEYSGYFHFREIVRDSFIPRQRIHCIYVTLIQFKTIDSIVLRG